MEGTIYFSIFVTDYILILMKINSLLISCLIMMGSCAEQPSKTIEKESMEAKSMLQGLWLDDSSETPLLRIEGDSIYYVDNYAAPVAFKIFNDTMKTYGSNPTSYHILKQDENLFWIQSAMGETLELSKAEDVIDSLSFTNEKETPTPISTVIKKDHIVTYNNSRYHGYVYINPTNIKVFSPEITEEGLEIDNVYYDNIIHICVYEGKSKLFGQDIKKQHFEKLIPPEYFQRSILSDMDFKGVNAKGYQYQATVCIPNSVSCYLINISITKDGDMNYELAL